MIEGQEGVSWEQWVALARACEEGGLEGLFRSDHYQSVFDVAGRGSLDAWATLCGLGGRHGAHPSRDDGLSGDVSAAFRAREDGRDRRPHLGWAGRARARRRLERPRARGLRLPVPGARRADGDPRGAARDRPPAVDGGGVLVRGASLQAGGLPGRAEAAAAAASAADHRRRAPAPAPRGSPRAGRTSTTRVRHRRRTAASGGPGSSRRASRWGASRSRSR